MCSVPIISLPTLPDGPSTAELLPALLGLSLTGIMLMTPCYEATDEAVASQPAEGRRIVDFAYAYLNPAAQRMLHQPAYPTATLRTLYPHVVATGVFAYYCQVFEQATPGEARHYEVNYQHDGLDNYFLLAAQRCGPMLLVSFSDTATHPRTPVEEALRASQASELAANVELRRTQHQLRQLNEELENRVEERSRALHLAQAGAEVQRQRLEQFFRQVPAAICILDGPELVYEMVNPYCQRLFPNEVLVGQPVLKVQPNLADHEIWNRLRHVYSTGETLAGLGERMRLPGAAGQPWQTFYFDYVYQARYNERGDIDGVLVCAFDVTARVLAHQQAEALQAAALAAAQQLAAQRESFYQVFEQTPALICLLRGPELRLDYGNLAFRQLYAGRELLGLPLAEIQPGLAAQGFGALLDQVYATGEIYQATEALGLVGSPEHGPGPERYFDFTYQPFREQGQVVGIAVFAFEVTEQVANRRQAAHSKSQHQHLAQHLVYINERLSISNTELLAASEEGQKANQELAAANQELRRTNADLDNFIYTASHDLRSPITNIEGLLRALRTELPAASQVGDVPLMLELIQQSVDRFKRTIEHLTDIVRLQHEFSQPTVPVLLAPIIQDVRLDLAPLAAQVAVRLDVNVQDCPTIWSSEKSLRSIVYNLLSNAIKYRAPERVLWVRVRCFASGRYTVLEVQDNGLGLDLARAPRLFEMFQRFHTHVEGSGMGLYMVKRLVESTGGHLDIQSQPGEGTTVAAYFRH